MNATKSQLLNQMSYFIGTQYYYPLWPKVLLTDGTKYLADAAACYWLMDAIASHIQRLPFSECFCSCKLTKNASGATLVIDDGNGSVLATQRIPYTDFALDQIHLYACYSDERWVIMLTGEH